MPNSKPSDIIVVGNTSDDPFAIDVAFSVGQMEDIADLISMKTFANSEFCPRFISDEEDLSQIGVSLEGKTVVIVSTSSRVAPPSSRWPIVTRRRGSRLIARWLVESGGAVTVNDAAGFAKLFKLDDWNDVVIVAQGSRLQHYLNNRLILDCTDDEPRLALREGVLALQLHGGKPMWVEFKDVRIKDIP